MSDLSEEYLYTICNCFQIKKTNNATTQSIHCVRTCVSVSDQRQDETNTANILTLHQKTRIKRVFY